VSLKICMFKVWRLMVLINDSDFAAADYLGGKVTSRCSSCGSEFNPFFDTCPKDGCGCSDFTRSFSLEDPATKNNIIVLFGEVYNVNVFHTHPDYSPSGWVFECPATGDESSVFRTHTECVREAVVWVKGNRKCIIRG